MASDSQITDGGRGLSYPAQKLHPLGSHAAWGGSGSRAVLYDVEHHPDWPGEMLIVRTNADGAEDFKIAVTPLDKPETSTAAA